MSLGTWWPDRRVDCAVFGSGFNSLFHILHVARADLCILLAE